MSDNGAFAFLRSHGSLVKVGAIFLFGVLLIILGGAWQSEPRESSGLDTELSELCSSVAGVGECEVMVTYSEGGEVYAVAILCEGADSAAVRESLVDIVGSLFGIGSNRISIVKSKK